MTNRQQFLTPRYDSVKTHPIPVVIVNHQYVYALGITGSADMDKVNGTPQRKVPHGLNLELPNGRVLKINGPLTGTFTPEKYGKHGLNTIHVPWNFVQNVEFGLRLPIEGGEDLFIPLNVERQGKVNGLPQWKTNVTIILPRMEATASFSATLVQKAASGDTIGDDTKVVSYSAFVAARLPAEVYENGTELVPA